MEPFEPPSCNPSALSNPADGATAADGRLGGRSLDPDPHGQPHFQPQPQPQLQRRAEDEQQQRSRLTLASLDLEEQPPEAGHKDAQFQQHHGGLALVTVDFDHGDNITDTTVADTPLYEAQVRDDSSKDWIRYWDWYS